MCVCEFFVCDRPNAQTIIDDTFLSNEANNEWQNRHQNYCLKTEEKKNNKSIL